MVKFNPKAAQFYAQTLQQVIQTTQDAAENVEPYYTKLKGHLDDQSLAELSDGEFAEIKAEFEDATKQYLDNANSLLKVQTPVRFMGVHKSLASNYELYAKATKSMTDSLNLSDKTVNMDDFLASEVDQETYMNKIQIAIGKIMQSTM